MGIIRRQTIKVTLVQYLSLIIGALSVIFIYPLNLEIHGLYISMMAIPTFVVPVVTLGAQFIGIRYFPEFKNSSNGNNGFLSLLLLITSVGFGIFMIVVFIFRSEIYHYYQEEPLLVRYLPWVIPMILLIALTNIFAVYCYNYSRTVVPMIVMQLPKILFPFLMLMFIFEWISRDVMIDGVILSLGLGLATLAFYLWSQRTLHFSAIRYPNGDRMKAGIIKFGLISMLTGLGSLVAISMDVFSIQYYLTLQDVSIYGIAVFMATVISIPYVSMMGIASPVISKAWSVNDMSEIELVYKKSSLNLFIIGLFFFLLIWVNLDDFYAVHPKGDLLKAGKWAFLFLGLSKLFDMITGVNDLIISNSKKYKFLLIASVVLAIWSIAFNLYLIPIYGILGAGIASASAFFVYNLMKWIFIQAQFGLNPFSRKTAYVLVLGLLSGLILLLIPSFLHPILMIAIKSILLGLMFGIPILYFNISPDLTSAFSTKMRLRKL
ncbi:MAG: polysaccharide biosynthesis C-terminal domain-containing protein [Saprospiraceae bacterium]